VKMKPNYELRQRYGKTQSVIRERQIKDKSTIKPNVKTSEDAQTKTTKTTKSKTFAESNIVIRFRKIHVLCPVLFFLCLCMSLSMNRRQFVFVSLCIACVLGLGLGLRLGLGLGNSLSSST
jgi:hypothetical protein